jgi:hypothetical protein
MKCKRAQCPRKVEKMSKIIENVEDVKLLISKYEWLKDRVIDLLDDDYDGNIEEINIGVSDDDLEISFETNHYCYGEHFTGYYDEVVPIAWLFLDDEELKKIKKEKKEAEKEARQRAEELKEIWKKQAKEQEERAEYERLKAKYGNL